MEKNNDVSGLALDRLITQFKGKPVFTGLVRALMKDHEEFENSTWKMFSELNLANATGFQLDRLGETLAVARAGKPDVVYRTRLTAAIIQYMSSGRWEQVVSGFRLLSGSRFVQGEEIFPAGVILTGSGSTVIGEVDLLEMVDALRKVRAVGIRINTILVSGDPPFCFAGDPDPLGAGFGDATDPEVGGYFSSIITI